MPPKPPQPPQSSQPEKSRPEILDMSYKERLVTVLLSLVMMEVGLTGKWPLMTTALVVAGFAHSNADRIQQSFTSLLWTQPENVPENQGEKQTVEDYAARERDQVVGVALT